MSYLDPKYKTIFLRVYSNEIDFGALVFENSSLSIPAFYQDIVEAGGGPLTKTLTCAGLGSNEVTGELVVIDLDINRNAFLLLRDMMLVQKKNTNYYWVGLD